MNSDQLVTLAAAGVTLARGMVLEITPGGEIFVGVRADPPLRLLCDCLHTGDEPTLTLRPGDRVLVGLPKNTEEPGCVLGRLGAYEPPDPEEQRHVVIEADKDLILRCGESSLTLREDGKVLIKGVDVVSRAERNQRIKGGSVQIN